MKTEDLLCYRGNENFSYFFKKVVISSLSPTEKHTYILEGLNDRHINIGGVMIELGLITNK